MKMYDQRTDTALSAVLTGPVRDALIAAVQRAYHTVSTKYHDPDDGCDGQSFGYMVWKVLENEIRLLAERDPALGITIEPHAFLFRFRVGGFQFAIHSLGPTAVKNIDDSFPNNRCASGRLAVDNIYLRLELGDDAYIPHSLVIGHIGNPESGCEQVWVVEPTDSHKGAIIAWGFRRELWRWDGQMSLAVAAPDIPQAAEPTPIEITLKTQRKVNPSA